MFNDFANKNTETSGSLEIYSCFLVPNLERKEKWLNFYDGPHFILQCRSLCDYSILTPSSTASVHSAQMGEVSGGSYARIDGNKEMPDFGITSLCIKPKRESDYWPNSQNVAPLPHTLVNLLNSGQMNDAFSWVICRDKFQCNAYLISAFPFILLL